MTNPTPHGQVPEALTHERDRAIMEGERNASLDAYSRVVLLTSAESRLYEAAFTNGWDRCAAHVQNPAEIEHVANDVSKNGAKSNTSQQPAPAGATVDEGFLRSVVMLCNNKGASPESIENFDSDDKWIADLWRLAEQGLRKAPQQPAPATQQYPTGWYVTGCSRLLDEDDAKAEARHIGGTARAMPLYNAPQPSPTPQADSQPALPEITADCHPNLIAAELRRLHAENGRLASRLKAYEDLDEAASDVQLLRMGYAAARLEIQSLHARIKTMRAPADSVLEDAARLDFLIEQRAYVVSDPDACPGYWLHFVHKETGKCLAQADEHPTPRAAIDAARKQGANHE